MTDQTQTETQPTTPPSAADSASAPASAPAPAPPAASRPDWLAETFWDAASNAPKLDALGEHVKGLEAVKAEMAVKAATVPDSADKYEFKLPADFKAPDGFDIELKADDPIVGVFRETAHKVGLSQDGFQAFVGLYAQHRLQQAQAESEALDAAKAERVKTLGPNGQKRIDDVQSVLATKYGELPPVMDLLLYSKGGVELMERLIAGNVGSGLGSFGQNGRAAPQDSNDARIRAMYPSMKN